MFMFVALVCLPDEGIQAIQHMYNALYGMLSQLGTVPLYNLRLFNMLSIQFAN